MTDIYLNHDGYFKRNYSRLEIAKQHLNHYFPSEVVRLLDLTSLKICKDSFIDPQMREYFSDLLYQVKLKQGTDLYVYILCEHKSTPEPLVAFQLLRYMLKIWHKTSEGGKRKHFPVIIPYVIYHGKKEWKISEKFLELFQCPEELKPYVPQFEYELFDLSRLQNDEIQGVPELQATLMTMKHIFGPEL